ncbi:plasmid replication, integration and excision activator [Thermomonospora catenispora]|uniref:plasmid replication, integration and excision activator n=1 Tax=Thermomonospora catenispora TaxID=2493090 RepID=UPI001123447D|nr:plasmid replication, integration and excision activator [Thermomonospora catenispora]TNY37759.1 plasmid replication, integration and excision activator [Thermomonospora catenispora]
MGIQGRIPVEFGQVFPHGVYATGQAEPLTNFDTKRQEIDKDTGLPVWVVDVYDADPAARHKASAIRVRVIARECPVLPEPVMGPFRPVEFTGMTVTPYVEVSGRNPQGEPITRIAYSYRATGVQAPGGSAAGRGGARPAAGKDAA